MSLGHKLVQYFRDLLQLWQVLAKVHISETPIKQEVHKLLQATILEARNLFKLILSYRIVNYIAQDFHYHSFGLDNQESPYLGHNILDCQHFLNNNQDINRNRDPIH